MDYELKTNYFFKFNKDPKPCLICGTYFKPTSPNAKYCSSECKRKAEDRRKERYSVLSKRMKNRKKIKKVTEKLRRQLGGQNE